MILGSAARDTLADNLRTTSNRGRLGPQFRVSLAVLFSSCGIWILAFGLGFLDDPQSPIPHASAWAWSVPATFVFFRLAAAVHFGIAVGAIYGWTMQGVADCVFAALYLATSAALLFRERVGIAAALAVSLTSTIVLVFSDIRFIVSPRASTFQFCITAVALVGYAFLTYYLGKAQLAVLR